MPGFEICNSGDGPSAKEDIYRSYRWKLAGIIGAGVSLQRKHQDLVLDCTLPSMDFDILTVQGMSLEYKIPKKPTFNNVDITFYDFGGLQTEFETWMSKIWSPSKGLFEGKAPTEIKAVIKVDLLDNAGKGTRNYELHGAWPKRLSHSKLSMSDDSLKTLVVEFVYDFYTVKDSA
jgi:hypothetical protein